MTDKTSSLFNEFSINDIQKSNDYFHTETLKKASIIYGATLPEIVVKRLETELNHIINNGFSSAYMIAHLIVKYVHDNGLHTCSRGAIGSSLVAFLFGITNVNPLPPHYYCSNCKHTEFVLDNSVYSGYHLPEKECPICRSKLSVDGNNISYEFFMGLEGDKLPDIKLNIPFSFEDNVLQYINENFWQEFVSTTNAYSVENEHVVDSKFQNLNANICKTDILGFVPLEILSLLKKSTGVSLKDINIKDPEIYKLFVDSRSIGINSDEPATLGIPEFNIKYVRNIIKLTRPFEFGDLVKISNLVHGRNVWCDNTEYLLTNNICTLKDLPTSSEDVYKYLTSCEIEKTTAFRIAETVRQGTFKNSSFNKELKIIEIFNLHNIPQWYFDLLCMVRDTFPKAHSVEYTKLALVFAWYKIYYPVEFYTATFNVRYPDIQFDFINKEKDSFQMTPLLTDLDEDEISLFKECTERGIIFEQNKNCSKCSETYSAGNGKILVNYK